MSKPLPKNVKLGYYVPQDSTPPLTKKEISKIFKRIREDYNFPVKKVHRLKANDV